MKLVNFTQITLAMLVNIVSTMALAETTHIKIIVPSRNHTKIEFHKMIEDGYTVREDQSAQLNDTLKTIKIRQIDPSKKEYVEFIQGELAQPYRPAQIATEPAKAKTLRDLVKEL